MAKRKQHGLCALCLQDREPRRSHLLGRAIYLLNRDGKDEPVLMTPQLIMPLANDRASCRENVIASIPSKMCLLWTGMLFARGWG